MLKLRESSTMNLQSNHDAWKLVEHRLPGPGFFNRCFKYFALHLYNILPKTTRQLGNFETHKKRLKTSIFSETFDLKTKTIRDCFAT